MFICTVGLRKLYVHVRNVTVVASIDCSPCLAIDLKRDMAVYEGACKNGKVELMMTISDENFMDLVSGKLDGQKVLTSHT